MDRQGRVLVPASVRRKLRPPPTWSPERRRYRKWPRLSARVEEGELAITTVVHVSETVNMVESRLGLAESLGLVARLLTSDDVEVLEVAARDYEEALPAS